MNIYVCIIYASYNTYIYPNAYVKQKLYTIVNV